MCSLKEMQMWFRTRTVRQTVMILEDLQARRLVTYNILGHGKLVRFKILGWKKHNTVLDYNAPCFKDTGFFFMPIDTANELIGIGRCSEMDVVLDLWINTIYNDDHVLGSEVGPVVYFRNGTGNPTLSFVELGERWGVSKATVSRMLNRLAKKDYLSLFSYPGRQGSVIYLRSYLSTMFQVCDILLDKEEVAMSLNIAYSQDELDTPVTKAASSVSDQEICVSNPAALPLVGKVQKTLACQGFSCFECPKAIYKLSPLSGCKEISLQHRAKMLFGRMPNQRLTISCQGKYDVFVFEISTARSTLKTRMEDKR